MFGLCHALREELFRERRWQARSTQLAAEDPAPGSCRRQTNKQTRAVLNVTVGDGRRSEPVGPPVTCEAGPSPLPAWGGCCPTVTLGSQELIRLLLGSLLPQGALTWPNPLFIASTKARRQGCPLPGSCESALSSGACRQRCPLALLPWLAGTGRGLILLPFYQLPFLTS